MWKQLTAAILMLAFMASTFCQAVIVANYYANMAAYAKSCVNKARPQMHCNGKCQMMQKLQQEEKQQQDNPERKAENKTEIIANKSFDSQLPLLSSTVVDTDFLSYAENCPRSFQMGIFHPPQA
jgi:hypothetical protein